MKQPDEYRIQTRAEHNREVRRLWVVCGIMATLVLLAAAGGVFALLSQGQPWSKIANICAVTFGIIILAYGISVFIPSLFTSLKRMALSMDLGRRGLEVGQQTAAVLLEVRKEIKPAIDDLRKTTKSIDRLVGRMDKHLSDEFFSQVNDALGDIAFSKEPLPLPVPRLGLGDNGKGRQATEAAATEEV